MTRLYSYIKFFENQEISVCVQRKKLNDIVLYIKKCDNVFERDYNRISK